MREVLVRGVSSSRGSKTITLASPTPEKILIPMPWVVEVSSSASGSERIELVETGESPECFVAEVVESSPSILSIPSLSHEGADILRAGAISLWSWTCTRLEAKSPDMILKEEAEVMSTFQVLARLGLEVVPDLQGKLQAFFQMAREVVSLLAVACQDDFFEMSREMVLLAMSSEDLALRRHGEVQEVAMLESEAATLEARARDSWVHAQERRSVVTQLDLEHFSTHSYLRGEHSSRAGQTLGIFIFGVRSC
ncbi:hypothetical protein LIER_40164 [Lithospermum erythrorhizon]|uniref:Uncharacterized protein n=1 Tax=Lithospermum erythrorhizon TaxID=34254 RepID=A0AAV3QRX9_LITER